MSLADDVVEIAEEMFELSKDHQDLLINHMAVKMVAMTMIGMMFQDLRDAIIQQITPKLDRDPASATFGLTEAVDELFDEIRLGVGCAGIYST